MARPTETIAKTIVFIFIPRSISMLRRTRHVSGSCYHRIMFLRPRDAERGIDVELFLAKKKHYGSTSCVSASQIASANITTDNAATTPITAVVGGGSRPTACPAVWPYGTAIAIFSTSACRRTVIMPCLRPLATSHQFIGYATMKPVSSAMLMTNQNSGTSGRGL
jgi:hypothetical protein